jgi:mono/diheme cytochrome c family protein
VVCARRMSACAAWLAAAAWTGVLPAQDFFESRIRPVLIANCYGCHAETRTSGLRVDSREGLLKGGNAGPAIVPGDPEHSLLIQAVTHTHERYKMPLGKKLAPAEIEDLKTWVRAGAIWPEHAAAPVQARGSRISAAQRAFWSFRPLEKISGDIDRLVMERLQRAGIQPVGLASRRALIRRATFDLTGLPPTPSEIDSFMQDESAVAFAKVIDRLLASPHFGERWGRYWLDVARYAEDDIRGLSRESYPNAWRYRDWVVQAFNSDMPYDRFVMAQIAADLMPGQSDLAALGFFGLGPWYYDLTVPPLARADERHDRVDAVSRGFLGLTVACARCHDHKFDPISTADYYALAGVFASSDYVEYPLAPPSVVEEYARQEAQIQEQEKSLREQTQKLDAARSEHLARQTEAYLMAVWRGGQDEKLDGEALQRWTEYLRKTNRDHPLLQGWDELVARQATEEEVRNFAHRFQELVLSILAEKKTIDDENQALLAQHRPQKSSMKRLPNGYTSYDEFCPGCDVEVKALARDKYVLWNDLFAAKRAVLATDEKNPDPSLAGLREQLERLKKALPEQYPYLHGIGEGQAPANLRIHVRGSPYNFGDEAPRRFLAVLCEGDPQPFTKGSGRLELAEAIVRHPLAARVMANRVWQHLFGEGLVRTPGNFGHTGQPPTHPELLEWLAGRLVDHHWSIKGLIREIMLSQTYRRSSDYSAANYARDPDNRLLWRMSRRRLDAEALRDSLLWVSGNLDEKVGGRSVDLATDMRRRTIYGKVSRFKLNETLALFDFPSPGATSEKRNVTNVPMQRLFYLNNELVAAQAAALAERITQADASDETRIRKLYALLFGRPADAGEVEQGREFAADGWPQYVQVLMMSNEFSFLD